MFTAIAMVLVGVWLIVTSQGHVSTTVTLIFGIAATALAVLDLTRGYWPANRRP